MRFYIIDFGSKRLCDGTGHIYFFLVFWIHFLLNNLLNDTNTNQILSTENISPRLLEKREKGL